MPTEYARYFPKIESLAVRRYAPALIVSLFLCAFFSNAVHAGPWMDPGDSALRHDVQLLSDAGVIKVPLSTWPLAWADVARDAQGYEGNLSPALTAARLRVLRQYRRESRVHEISPHLRLAAANHPIQFRSFEDTPREAGELAAGAEWTGTTFAYRLQATGAESPDDHRPIRLDGSYAAAILGNWAFSAGAQQRWWGPGWEGGLILSNNARPIPGITLQRYYSDAFENKLLHWLGPWQFLFTVGQLEDNRDVPGALFLGMRVNFRPIPSLELGVSRTAQWGGQGRPEDISALRRVLLGEDNTGTNGVTTANEPGNQLAGFDFRWQSPVFRAPYAVYGQFIGEDEAGGLPSKYIGMAGVETWGPWGNEGASWRLHAEYANTAVNGFLGGREQFGAAYTHHIYTDGYTYRGRIIGDSLGGDGREASLGILYATAEGKSWDILLRRIEPKYNVAASPAYLSVQLGHRFSWWKHTISLHVGAMQRHLQSGDDIEGQADAQWEWRF